MHVTMNALSERVKSSFNITPTLQNAKILLKANKTLFSLLSYSGTFYFINSSNHHRNSSHRYIWRSRVVNFTLLFKERKFCGCKTLFLRFSGVISINNTLLINARKYESNLNLID